MTVRPRQFQEGVVLKDKTTPLDAEGQVANRNNRIKAFTEAQEREVITEDQTQTLQNKTIDGTAATGNNTISADASNVTYNNATSGLAATDLQTAIDELDTALENQNEASEIAYDNTTSGLTATNVQTAIDEVEGRVDAIEGETYVNSFNTRTGDVLPESGDYTSTQVTYDNTTSGLLATNSQSAIDEVEGRVDTAESNIATNTSNISTNTTTISDHITDTMDAHAASAITNTPTGNLAATNVQGALNELQSDIDTRALDSDLTAHISDPTDAHSASAITNVPSGNLVATDVQAALDELQTDIDTRALDSDLTLHTSASSGVHGVTGNVVGDTDTQILTNKTLQGASIEDPSRLDVRKDTRANLEVYATTADEGQLVFATDEDSYFGIVNNELVELGSGGVGSPYTYFVENFEDNDASVFSVSGVTIVGNETTNPLYGTRSIVLTQVSGSLNDSILWDVNVPIQQGQQNTNNVMNIGVRTPTLNPTGLYRIKVVESTDGIVFTDIENSITDFTPEISTQIVPVRFIPQENSTFVKFIIEILNENIGEELVIDNVEFTTLSQTSIIFDNIDSNVSFPIVVNNLGTITNASAKYDVTGSRIKVTARFNVGTPAAALASIELPNNFTLVDNLDGNTVAVGNYYRDDGLEFTSGPMLTNTTNSSTLIFFGGQIAISTDSSGVAGQRSPLDRQNGDFLFSPSEAVSIEFEVEINELSNTGSGVVSRGELISPITERILTADVVTNGVISDLTFTNLEIDKTYEISGQFATTNTSDDGGRIDILNGAQVISHFDFNPDGPNNIEWTNYVNVKFTATDTTLTFTGVSLAANSALRGNNTKEETFVQLQNLNTNVAVIIPNPIVVTTGTEYLTNRVIDGQEVFAVELEGSSIGSGDTTIATIATGLNIVSGNLVTETGGFHNIGTLVDTSGNRVISDYNDTTGVVRIRNNTLSTFNVKVKLEYTK